MDRANVYVLLFLLFSTVSIYGQNCLQFDGANDYITIDDQLSFSGGYTIEAWFYSQASGEQNILSATDSNNQHGIIIAIDSGDRYRFLHRDPSGSSGERNIRVGASNFVNSWHHIAAVFDGGSTFLYLDGAVIGSMTGANAFSSSMDITMGRLSPINSSRYFNGMLDEVRIWNVARTQSEIQSEMNTELAGDEAGLVAYFPFNQESGDVLEDSTANGYDGALHNFALPNAWVTSTAPNYMPPGNFLGFDGVDDYVEIPNTDSLDLIDDMTIELWVRFDSLAYDPQCLFAKGESNSDAYSMMLSPDSLLKFHTGSMTLEYHWAELVVDTWNHLAVVCNGDSTKIYINGREKVAYLEGTMATNTEMLRLGGSSGANTYPLSGGIDEFRVWNVVRTQQQIQDNRFHQPSADEPGLVVYYRFDQGDAGENNTSLLTEVVDHTNTHHGVLHNFALAGDSSNWLATGYDAALVQSTTGVHSVTGATADVSAEIYRTGSTLVSVRGVCYSAANNSPTTDDSTVEEVNPGGVSAGAYTTSLSGLDGNTRYYARCFASNEVETIYGETCQFTTHTSPNAPDSQACDIVFSQITSTQANIAWTNGNGDNRVVFLLPG